MSSPVKEIREKFGQSQQWWADYLSLTLGQLKMAENGKRSLPTAALLKLSALALSDAGVQTTTGKAATKKGKPASPPNKRLLTQSKKMQQQAEKAEQQLAICQLRYAQAANSLAMAVQLLSKPAKTEEAKKDKLLLELLQTAATKQLEQYGPEAQNFLQWKIDCYTYGAARAAELSGQTE